MKKCYLLILSAIFYSFIIGSIGTESGRKREKLFDNLIYQLKFNPENKNLKKEIYSLSYQNIENLVRYREPVLKSIYKKLLKSTNFYIRFKAIYGLRYINGKPEDIISFVTDKNPLIQDIALSTLAETGNQNTAKFLEKISNRITNFYIKNSLEFTVKKIKYKLKKLFNFNYGIQENPVKKFLYYKSGEKIKNYQERFTSLYLEEKEIPVADKFTEPVIDYWREFIIKGRRISFGVGGKIKHAGDDCGWFRDGSSVFAIGNGIVRLIHHSPDWGFLILIEHKLKNGNYICSVYGHLSDEIYIKAGDIVKRGQKIGTIGPSYTVINGGYGAHLHFAISKGRWFKPDDLIFNKVEVMVDGKTLYRVTEYRFGKNELILKYDNGLEIKVTGRRKGVDINSYFFWLKGYTYAKDLKEWIDPQQFFKHKY